MKKIVIEKRKLYITLIVIVSLILIGIIGTFIYINYGTVNETRIKQIIYNKTKFKKGSIDFRKIELDGLKKKYNVDIIYNGILFNFVIDSKTGKILENDFDSYPDKEYKGSGSFDYISKDEAKKLVANDLGVDIKKVDFGSVKFKKGNYSAIYTIKASYDGSTYEYTVDGISGEVLVGYTKILKEKK